MVTHRPRVSRRALSILTGITAVAMGCRDAVAPTPAAPRSAPAHAPNLDTFIDPGEASPDIVTISLPSADIYNGSASVSGTFGFYTHPTLVTASISGGTETYTPNFDGIGPAQGPFGPYGRTSIGWTNSGFDFEQARIDGDPTYVFFFGNSRVFVASRAPLGTLTLDNYRTPLGNFVSCGPSHGTPCFTYGGDGGSVTLKRIESDLALTAERTTVGKGDTPYFDYRSAPQFAPSGDQLQWVVAASSWTPDSVTADDPIVSGAGRAACQPQFDPACRRVINASGTFTLSAWVNGALKTKSVHVTVPALKLTADPDSIGPGETTTLTASADGATTFDVQGYDFQPDGVTMASVRPGSGSPRADRRLAPGRLNDVQQADVCKQQDTRKVCPAQPDQTGVYTVRATVDGKAMTATKRVIVGGVAIKIIKVAGPNVGGSFTSKFEAEDKITLEAQVTPATLASSVQWEVTDADDDQAQTLAPTSVAPGASSSFLVPNQVTSRWPTDHNESLQLSRKWLRYKVVAFVIVQGKTYRSDPAFVQSDLEDTMREEYIEFGFDDGFHHVPSHDAFIDHPQINAYHPDGPGENAGDYVKELLEPHFASELAGLRAAWGGAWQVNTIYRSPVHNLLHVSASSGPSSASWHMWGCAADLQTFPAPRTTAADIAKAKAFHQALSALAKRRGFGVEPLEKSGVGHVHVELDCP